MLFHEGTGRHSMEEAEERGKVLLKALSQYLGQKKFLMSEKPTRVSDFLLVKKKKKKKLLVFEMRKPSVNRGYDCLARCHCLWTLVSNLVLTYRARTEEVHEGSLSELGSVFGTHEDRV